MAPHAQRSSGAPARRSRWQIGAAAAAVVAVLLLAA
jgi:hypothetical protein